MNIVGIVPARMSASRFPGKPMKKIAGTTMIEHCFCRTNLVDGIIATYVATCDEEIYDHITSIGGNAVMTSNSHTRATTRTAEAMEKIEKDTGQQVDVVVMVQGDEPMTHPDMITEAVNPMLKNKDILVTNLLGDIEDVKEFEDRNCIKVVCDLNSDALFFSREPIPTRKFGDTLMKKQVCIIPFRRDFLLKYTKLSPTPLEIAESVDMMRVLEHGLKVRMIPTTHQTHAVDTKEDLDKVSLIMKQQV